MPKLLLRLLIRSGYAGLVFACVVLTAYFSFSLFVRSGATSVPDLKGLSKSEAIDLLNDQGLDLQLGENAGRFDPDVLAGLVMRQTPAPRTLVKRGTEIEVVLSLGPERSEVPDLDGKALSAALVTLSAAGLSLGRTASVKSRREPGAVVMQSPAAGQTVSPGTPVDVLMADPDTSRTFVMPDLIYRDYDRLRPFFENRGFRFGSVKFERYDGVASGVVLRQFPLAGHPLTPRDAISLVVAAPDEGVAPASGDRG